MAVTGIMSTVCAGAVLFFVYFLVSLWKHSGNRHATYLLRTRSHLSYENGSQPRHYCAPASINIATFGPSARCWPAWKPASAERPQKYRYLLFLRLGAATEIPPASGDVLRRREQ
ncbi:MAG: hypothetical protein ACRD2U_02360 [Terriglobales bacterium]